MSTPLSVRKVRRWRVLWENQWAPTHVCLAVFDASVSSPCVTDHMCSMYPCYGAVPHVVLTRVVVLATLGIKGALFLLLAFPLDTSPSPYDADFVTVSTLILSRDCTRLAK